MSGSPQTRMLLSALMNIIIVITVLLTVRIVVDFFGLISGTQFGSVVKSLTSVFVPDFGVALVRTPYGGFFNVEAASVVIALLLIEWLLATVRSRA